MGNIQQALSGIALAAISSKIGGDRKKAVAANQEQETPVDVSKEKTNEIYVESVKKATDSNALLKNRDIALKVSKEYGDFIQQSNTARKERLSKLKKASEKEAANELFDKANKEKHRDIMKRLTAIHKDKPFKKDRPKEEDN